MPRHALTCSSVLSAMLLALVSGAGMGCSQILGIEDLPALDPDARRPADAREIDGRDRDAREPDAREPDAGEPPDAAVLPPDGVLVDRSLLTRYFIDESNSGSDVVELQDSADNPLPLAIDYDGQGAFVEEGGNRGLRWNELTGSGRASAPVEASGKIQQSLDGSTRATIEVVVDIDEFVAGSRLSHIGEQSDRGVFTLGLEEPASVRFILNNDDAEAHSWSVTLVGRGRTVLHLVLDTTRANTAARARLHVDGVEQINLGNEPLTHNEEIDMSSNNHFYVLGNTEEGDRGIVGTIFYAAMYSTDLDPFEVQHNAEVLLANDDAPGN